MSEILRKGDYLPGKGYYLLCGFDKCADPYFFGPKNKKYHTECKKRNDAEKRSEKREKTKEENRIMNINLSILEELYPQSNGSVEILKIDFMIKGFDFMAPSRRIKTKEYGYECHIVHGFAYRYIDKRDTIIIYTKDELHSL